VRRGNLETRVHDKGYYFPFSHFAACSFGGGCVIFWSESIHFYMLIVVASCFLLAWFRQKSTQSSRFTAQKPARGDYFCGVAREKSRIIMRPRKGLKRSRVAGVLTWLLTE
jgi:hypothetical protein